jgi:phytanoyl-CoA hydroxylase
MADTTALPPLDTKFTLGPTITPEQRAFLDAYGFLHFPGVASAAEVAMIGQERDRLEARWIAEQKSSICGIPLFRGHGAEGQPIIQRLPFCSRFSPGISAFVRDPRFEAIRKLKGDDARVGEHEKDGVVINRYMNVPGSGYDRLGWHTDGLRDLFYLRMPKEMLNVGLHLDDIKKEDGGLRLIPGTHKQGFWSMCFRKIYFVSHAPDPREIAIETKAGDLTIHDGRLWHRVERSPHVGARSQRRSMYVPYLTGPYEPKSEDSKTPAYHHLGEAMRALKQAPFKARRRDLAARAP